MADDFNFKVKPERISSVMPLMHTTLAPLSAGPNDPPSPEVTPDQPDMPEVNPDVPMPEGNPDVLPDIPPVDRPEMHQRPF